MIETLPDFAVYDNKTAAELINAQSGRRFIAASTLARLAREEVVECTRNGRKVGWTAEQLRGVVAYLTSREKQPVGRLPSRPSARRATGGTARAGSIAPLVAKPAPRYGRRSG